jgi:hypothetical protein
MKSIYQNFESAEQKSMKALNTQSANDETRIRLLATVLCYAKELLLLMQTHQRTSQLMDGETTRKLRLMIDGIMIRFVLKWKYVYYTDYKSSARKKKGFGLVDDINKVSVEIEKLVIAISRRDKDLLTPAILEAVENVKQHVKDFRARLNSDGMGKLDALYNLKRWPRHVSVSDEEEKDCNHLVEEIASSILEKALGHTQTAVHIEFNGESLNISTTIDHLSHATVDRRSKRLSDADLRKMYGSPYASRQNHVPINKPSGLDPKSDIRDAGRSDDDELSLHSYDLNTEGDSKSEKSFDPDGDAAGNNTAGSDTSEESFDASDSIEESSISEDESQESVDGDREYQERGDKDTPVPSSHSSQSDTDESDNSIQISNKPTQQGRRRGGWFNWGGK